MYQRYKCRLRRELCKHSGGQFVQWSYTCEVAMEGSYIGIHRSEATQLCAIRSG